MANKVRVWCLLETFSFVLYFKYLTLLAIDLILPSLHYV